MSRSSGHSTRSFENGTRRRPAKLDLSVVVPLFDESILVGELVDRLRTTLDALGTSWEAILVDDGSTDSTWSEIRRARRRDRRIKGISLSRNFGHQTAISAGLEHARGAAVVVMDGDLQDPPEAIPELWRAFRDRKDVVYAVRARRPEGGLLKLCYHLFYRFLNRSATIEMPLDAGDFCVMSRRVVTLINAMPERKRFVRGLRAWVGLRQAGVPIARASRAGGRPKYDARKLVGLALDGLIGFSDAPLRIAGVFGLVSIAGAAAAAVALTVRAFATARSPLGWTVAAVAALFFGGAQLLCAGILGEYVCRVFQQANGRPLYVVDRKIGLNRRRKAADRSRREIKRQEY